MTPQSDPFSTAVLISFIVALLGVIYRELRDSRDKLLAAKDKVIENRDQQITELKAENKAMAERSASLASSAEKMLDYFLDGNASPRSEDSGPSQGRRTQ